jgi:hypothetical protein
MTHADNKGVSGWSSCPACQFLVSPDAPRCPFCSADLARTAPIGAQAYAAAPPSAPPVAGPPPAGASTLPPPPPPPPGAAVTAPPPPASGAATPWSASAPSWPSAPSGQGTRRNVGRALLITGVGVAVVVALVAAVMAFSGGEDSRYPDAWDPRIEPLAKFVANERGMLFKHPVYVDFLDKAAFDEDMTADSAPTEEEREELDRYAGLFRAFGLMSGEIDLFETSNELMSDGVAAYYSHETKRIVVNGDVLDASTKVTLVHELTHALQDQYFDLSRMNEFDDVTGATFTAVIEGDATRIENIYYETLSDEELDEIAQSDEADAEEADYDRFPRVIVASFASPYVLGEPFVRILDEVDGASAIDEAIQSPPASEEQILDPFARLDGDEPVEVDEPELAEGEESFDGGTLGALFLYLMLNERIDPKEALAVADSWAGDAYVAFTRDGTTCVKAEIAAESSDALARLGRAFDSWAAGMPAGSVTYSVGERLSLETCDPGADAEIPAPVTPDLNPLMLPATRAEILASVLEEGLPAEKARCFVDHYFGGLTMEQITAEDDRFAAEIDALGAESAAACGLG